MMMRGLLVLSATVMVGCADLKTLEELELAALQSGDWSAVEQRERAIAKRRARAANACPSGLTKVCSGSVLRQHCYCSSDDDVRDFLDGL